MGAVRTSITDWRGSNSQDRTKSNSCEAKKHNQHLLITELPTILSTYKNKVDEMLEAGVEVSGFIEELNFAKMNVVDVRVDPK